MMESFTFASQPGHVVFGEGSRKQAWQWVDRLCCRRALVLSTPDQAKEADALRASLGSRAVGLFSGAAMHTPVGVTVRALDETARLDADCLVSLGGGSTTGLSKAIALRTDLPQIVIPTTYAGSEVTDILGQTEGRQKTTLRDPRVLPEVIIYDPALTLHLPVSISVVSGLNAMAHAAEALYASDRNPVTTMISLEGLRALSEALPALVADPMSMRARSGALYGAWLCGKALGSVAMAFHHKLCHTLGGSFDLPHAETHAIMLPHTLAFNAQAVPDLLAPMAALFGGDLARGMWTFAKTLGAPTALRDIGLTEASLDNAAKLATRDPYANPRDVETGAVRALLQRAWEGRAPIG